MKKIAFLTSKDLTGYITDEESLKDQFKSHEDFQIDYVVWNDEHVDWKVYDLAVIRTTWDYTNQLNSFLRTLKKIETSGVKLLNAFKVVEWNIKKSYLKELALNGVSVIESVFLEDGLSDSLKRINLWNCEKFVVKPIVGAGADKIKVFKKKELQEWFESQNEKTSIDFFIQPFMPEVFEGETSYFFFNGEFKYAVTKTPKSGDFRVQEEFGGSINPHCPSEYELGFAKKVISSLPFEKDLLYTRVDALNMSDAKNWKLMEVELIEPSMYFSRVKNSAKLFKAAILEHKF